MAKVLQHKVVSALPSTLEADSIYFVRVGTGYDQYVTNHSGQIVAYPMNRPASLPVLLGTGAMSYLALAGGSAVPLILAGGLSAQLPVSLYG